MIDAALMPSDCIR